MGNISRQALTKVVKQNLRSNLQGKVGSIMKQMGVNPAHSASLKGYEAKKVMMKLKQEGMLKPGASHLTAGQFETQFKKADAPTGPSQAVIKGRIALVRAERQKEFEKKETITQALSREAREKEAAGKAPVKSAARSQGTQLSGSVIGKAAQDATRPGSGALGSFSGADRIERSGGGSAPAPSREKGPEAIDPFGDE